jgi:integrase
VFYYRVGQGKRIRLPDITHPDFIAAYKAAIAGTSIQRGKEDARTLAWLINRYRESAEWLNLAQSTRIKRGNILKELSDKKGTIPFSKITKRAIDNGMQDRKQTPGSALDFLKTVSGLFKWAVPEHMPVDPTIGVKRIKSSTGGWKPWTVEDVIQFCTVWGIGTKQRLAMELYVHTGLRRSDLCVLGKQHLRGNLITIRPIKTARTTGVIVNITLPKRVLDVIEQSPVGDLTFMVTEFNKPFTAGGLGNWFGEACEDAGIHKSAHGLRKLAATLAADGGATAHELMSMFGWSTIQQAEVYTKGADRRRLGMKTSMLMSEQLANALNPHQTTGEGNSADSAV